VISTVDFVLLVLGLRLPEDHEPLPGPPKRKCRTRTYDVRAAYLWLGDLVEYEEIPLSPSNPPLR
jgi:hypothetical protein